MRRPRHVLGSATLFLICSLATVGRTASDQGTHGATVPVPFEYENPSAGTFPLYYELGKSFDRRKPTVFVIVDGQQFYVRRGAVGALQDSLFGDRFNVVGIPGRGTEEAVLNRTRHNGTTDWHLTWRLLRSENWVEDIERVRRALVGRDGQISLYGRSGGGLLVHQYLTKYGTRVSTAFTQAAVNPTLSPKHGTR